MRASRAARAAGKCRRDNGAQRGARRRGRSPSEFLVYVPRSYNNTPTPVFANFHGYLDDMNNFNDLTGLDTVRPWDGLRRA